jgi:hypothetical protein
MTYNNNNKLIDNDKIIFSMSGKTILQNQDGIVENLKKFKNKINLIILFESNFHSSFTNYLDNFDFSINIIFNKIYITI